jgi:DinB superfamily
MPDTIQPPIGPAGPVVLAPAIDELHHQFAQISADAEALVTTLRHDQFGWRPGPDVWSIAECLDHLNAAARAYLPKLDEAIAHAVPRSVDTDGPLRHSWAGRALLRAAEPPSRIRLRSPHVFQPAPGGSRGNVLATLRAYQLEYIDRLRRANGLDLSRTRVASPVSKWLRLSLGTLFAVIAAHQRRHLCQARRIVALPGFPR